MSWGTCACTLVAEAMTAATVKIGSVPRCRIEPVRMKGRDSDFMERSPRGQAFPADVLRGQCGQGPAVVCLDRSRPPPSSHESRVDDEIGPRASTRAGWTMRVALLMLIARQGLGALRAAFRT